LGNQRRERRKERKNIVAVVFRRKMNRGVHFDTMIIDALKSPSPIYLARYMGRAQLKMARRPNNP
jgi:hypothetical protein